MLLTAIEPLFKKRHFNTVSSYLSLILIILGEQLTSNILVTKFKRSFFSTKLIKSCRSVHQFPEKRIVLQDLSSLKYSICLYQTPASYL